MAIPVAAGFGPRHGAASAAPDPSGGLRSFPEPYATQLQAQSLERARNNLALTAELLTLLTLFERNSIPVVAFKGPVLAASLYGDIAFREFCDLDILIRKQDVLRVKEVMLAEGYGTDLPANRAAEEAYLRARYELHFTTQDRAYLIEIHQAFIAPFYCLPFDYESIWQGLEKQIFFGREILSLSPDDLLLVLCAHGAKHSWARLAWLCDVARLLVVKRDELNWPRILDRARASGAGRILLLALFLADHLLTAPVPAELRQRASEDAALIRLARGVVNSLYRQNSDAGGLRAHLFFLKTRERFRDKLAYCSRLAFTPNEEDHSALPLPALLSPLYYPLHAFRVFGKYGLSSLRSVR